MFRHVTTRLSGLVILIAGIWGGLIPFLGPYFHFTLGPDHAWTWTTGRLWLSVIPAAVAVLGGLILLGGGPRLSGRFGALIALAAGAWFAVGPDVSMLWNHGVSQAGAAHGQHTITRMLEYLTLHTGLGVLIAAFAAYALPGAAAYAYGRRRVERDAAIAGTGAAAGAAEAHHRDRVAARETTAPVAREEAVEPVAAREEPVAGREEPVANGQTNGFSNGQTTAAPAGAANGNTVSQPAYTETAPRRRGGLAGLFSRR
ncbi:MAG TPA: hypothetical protein VKR21_17510 [Solirubrobacteraceae bacterium]|nr:hypothetical protein [Solirubrobacteraceae bacterium]